VFLEVIANGVTVDVGSWLLLMGRHWIFIFDTLWSTLEIVPQGRWIGTWARMHEEVDKNGTMVSPMNMGGASIAWWPRMGLPSAKKAVMVAGKRPGTPMVDHVDLST